MGLAISSLFTKLFGKKNMRILMGKTQYSVLSVIVLLKYLNYNTIHIYI